MRKKEREVSDIQDIEQIIKRTDVCRVAFAENNIPYIVTMNFGYSGGEKRCLWFHCAKEGRKIEMIRKNNYVCFEMDTDHLLIEGSRACDFSMKYSSIIGYGNIFIVDDPEGCRYGLNQIMSHYTGRDEFEYKDETLGRTLVLRLEIVEMTGKRIL
jgi:uncharacterized protein